MNYHILIVVVECWTSHKNSYKVLFGSCVGNHEAGGASLACRGSYIYIFFCHFGSGRVGGFTGLSFISPFFFLLLHFFFVFFYRFILLAKRI